ncbi:MAG: hypothetical protein H7336_10380 [Bacteriovorax sp.]|nr:hypothetical protein [Bacteriovorax sp.]
MKFLAALLITLTMFLSTSAFAENINTEFKPTQDISHLKEGDLIEVEMKFWPIENADLSQFKKLEKTVFFNAFYLAQVLTLETSANNADVIELKALYIVKSAKPQPLFVFKYNESPVEMHLDGIKIEELKNKESDYFILDQSLNGSHLLIILGCILIALLAAAIYKRQALKQFIIGLKPDALKKAKKKYDEMFRKASKREDFEVIYQEKENWLKLLEIRAPAHNEFFKILNQYQFKKEWSNEDCGEVRSSFDIIRRSFEK